MGLTLDQQDAQSDNCLNEFLMTDLILKYKDCEETC